jgi:hypothetical protein
LLDSDSSLSHRSCLSLDLVPTSTVAGVLWSPLPDLLVEETLLSRSVAVDAAAPFGLLDSVRKDSRQDLTPVKGTDWDWILLGFQVDVLAWKLVMAAG